MTTFTIYTETPEHNPRIQMPEPEETPISMPLSSPEPMKADMPATIRKRFIISGNVQEAAYRVLVKSIARSMGITGLVRNLLDETVEIVCEGDPKTLEKFMKAIDRKGDPSSPMDLNVESIQETPAPTEGEFIKFKIEYDGMLTPEEQERAKIAREERMIVEAATLKDEIKTVGKGVRDMHIDMNKRFDHMAQRYDLIATSLVKAIDRMDQGFERMDKNFERSRKETAAQFKQSREGANRTNKEIAASNRELAKAVKFMIKKLSDKPPRKRPAAKRKR